MPPYEMRDRDVVWRELDPTIARSYVLDQLQMGLGLARAIAGRGLESAQFAAYVPRAISSEDAHRFESALGLSPPPLADPVSGHRLQSVLGEDEATLAFVFDALGGPGCIGLVEDHVSRAHDPNVGDDMGVPWVRHGEELYYLLDRDQMTESEVRSAFRRGWSWMGIAVITTAPDRLDGAGDALNPASIEGLAARATKLVVRAYDREGNVIVHL